MTARKRKRAGRPLDHRGVPRQVESVLPVPAPAARRLAAAAVGVAVLAVYVRTLSPTVAGGDSGELITVAATLGIAHPPGYPLYTLLAKLFTLLPFGSIAWRVNLLSAVCGAGAAALLFLAVVRWSGRLWSGLAAAALFAFSPRVWPHALTAEVFALNNLFIAGLIYLTVRYQQDRSGSAVGSDPSGDRRFNLACLIFFWIGLGLSNHHTLIFYAIPVGVFVIMEGGAAARRPQSLAILAACGLAGLLPYIYIPWASARVPLMSWGDQTTLHGFLDHLLRREYGTFSLGVQQQGPAVMDRLAAYVAGSFHDLLIVGPLLAAAGFVWSVRHRARPVAWCWAAAFGFFVVGFNSLANGPLEPGVSRFVEGRFWQQPHMVLCAFAGLGLCTLGSRFGSWGSRTIPVVAVALAIIQPVIHFRGQDKSRDVQLHDYLEAILDSQPHGSLLLETGDYIFHGLRYLQIIEGYRTDVRVLDQMVLGYPWHQRLANKYFPDVVLPGRRLLPRAERAGDYDMKALFDANRSRFPIFLCDVNLWEDARGPYTPWPSGLVDRVLPTPQEPALTSWIASARASFERVDATALQRHAEESWEHVALKYYWKQMGKYALSLGRWGQEHHDRVALTRAAQVMETMLAGWAEAPLELHRDLGIVYQQLAEQNPAYADQMRRELSTYLRSAPPTDPSLPAIRQILGETK